METFAPLSAIHDGISEKLYETFGDAYTIYPEEVRQGLTRPCFFIKLLKLSNTIERDQTYRRDHTYCIHFYPQNTKQPKAEYYQILDRLYAALAYIEVGGNLVRGTSMLSEMHNEILQFYINFNVRVRQMYAPIWMEYLEAIELRTKG